jgi:Amt family ammonium transporter
MDSGNTAWVLASAALVLFMTPGLAFFYGGMVRAKNMLAMLMQNFFCMGLVSVLWVLVAFSLSFGPDIGGGLLGNLSFAGLKGLMNVDMQIPGYTGALALSIPPLVFVVFQMMFAIITPALITGASADRMKFSGWVTFLAAWVILVYSPIAHWVFSPTGWLFSLGALDFAGGTVVHINAGIAGLALVLVLGKRKGWPAEAMAPHALPWTMIGAGILWFGWFGFNAGSALGANNTAAIAFVNTNTAAAAAMLSWLLVEKLKRGHATTLGGASGLVAGLVAITPCAGFVNPMASLAIGFLAGAICFFCCQIKFRFGFDDSLDVIAVHLIGGITGSLLLGVFATDAYGGLLAGGGAGQLGKQFVAVVATLVYSFVISYILAKVIDATIGLRVTSDEEAEGLDLTQHAESAYSAGDFGSMGRIG